MKCSNNNCQKDIDPEWKSCPFCMTPVPQTPGCKKCGENLQEGWKACPFCQTVVEAIDTGQTASSSFCFSCRTGLVQGSNFKCVECDEVFCEDCRMKLPDGVKKPICRECDEKQGLSQPLWDKKRAEDEAKEQEEARKAEERRKKEEAKRKLAEEDAREKKEAERKKAEELAKRAPEMVFVRGGSYQMGDLFGDGFDNEQPVHEVVLDDFYIGKYTVTFEEYDRYCEETGAKRPDDKGWGRGRRPVINVSWEDAQGYINWLNEKTGKKYRLPTEAEWEYACRSGGKKEKYSGSDKADSVAWHDGNLGDKTHPVGQKSGNGLGLYDMSGNVWEWVYDWYEEDYYGSSPKYNPQGPDYGEDRVLRGGTWVNGPVDVRSSYRGWYTPGDRSYDIGFRVALPPKD